MSIGNGNSICALVCFVVDPRFWGLGDSHLYPDWVTFVTQIVDTPFVQDVLS